MGLVLFYYAAVGSELAFRQDFGWAPTLVSAPLQVSYAFAYGVAAALGVWESGRLRRGAIWGLAPARSRYLIAAQALAPVVVLAWLMLILPVAIALVQGGALPTPTSVGPLLLGMLLCPAHATIGFAVGLRVPAVVGAPVLAVVVWLVVATSRATSERWRRHTLGQYQVRLEFGETATLTSLVAQALPTVGIAVAIGALWLPLRHLAVRLVIGAAVAVSCAVAAVESTRDWETTPPLNAAQAPMRCEGTMPRVCLPEATVGDLAAVHADVTAAIDDLVALGVSERPEVVTDSLPDGRGVRPSTPETWRLALTNGERQDNVRFRVVDEAVRFPCSSPDPAIALAAMMWVTERTGTADTHEEFLAGDPYLETSERQSARTAVDTVLAMTEEEQLTWYLQALRESCEADA
ncbi:hypothetical protein [Streptomyces marincola]|uniref:hypothetical protein n=1 Tax=Streptomyces marincola TaxID=2878388 RepID=UPI001CF40F91|nr:hypothetical protein [Streptomyces marincola]UCM88311.1 hypothetical protein LC193_10280 [Streptomyces marincola]